MMLSVLICLFVVFCSCAGTQIYPGIRQPVDLTGYTHSEEGISKVITHAMEQEKAAIMDQAPAFIAGISPHDDYQYAQSGYIHLYPHIKAKHVILIGVAHKAKNHPECFGKLVFDDYWAWHGPYHPAPISSLRKELLNRLPKESVMTSNELHAKEHSLEAMIPFLQHFNRRAEIIPILAPYMTWDQLNGLAKNFGCALADILKSRGLTLGEDVAILISSDSVHYGDKDWGGKSFADFGTNGAAYDQAVARDMALINNYLSNQVTVKKAKAFYHQVVAEDGFTYKITWCGRFSIPFGLSALAYLLEDLKLPNAQGKLLRYGTTLDPGRSDPEVPGLGVTAKANLRHWVGFVSLGYYF